MHCWVPKTSVLRLLTRGRRYWPLCGSGFSRPWVPDTVVEFPHTSCQHQHLAHALQDLLGSPTAASSRPASVEGPHSERIAILRWNSSAVPAWSVIPTCWDVCSHEITTTFRTASYYKEFFFWTNSTFKRQILVDILIAQRLTAHWPCSLQKYSCNFETF